MEHFEFAIRSDRVYTPTPACGSGLGRRCGGSIVKTYNERRMELLSRRLKGRLRHDGTPVRGFEQSVAQIRAEMELLSVREAKGN